MRVDVVNNWTLYYQQDHEGSVTHLTNASGAVIEKYRYDAFGAPTIYNSLNTQLSTSNYGNRFLFTGREYASTFSFYEYRARAYNPTLGRFMSEDPKGFDAGDYNLFRYCHNDPLDMTDPMGLLIIGFLTPPLPPPPAPREGSFQREFENTPLAKATTRQAFDNRIDAAAKSGTIDKRLENKFQVTSQLHKLALATQHYGGYGGYATGWGVVNALVGAAETGRIVVGQSKDFRGPLNVFSTYDNIIHGNLDSHPRLSLVAPLLAHEGEHLIDKLRDGWLNRELRGFAVEHGFADAMHVYDPNPRTREEIMQRYGLQ